LKSTIEPKQCSIQLQHRAPTTKRRDSCAKAACCGPYSRTLCTQICTVWPTAEVSSFFIFRTGTIQASTCRFTWVIRTNIATPFACARRSAACYMLRQFGFRRRKYSPAIIGLLFGSPVCPNGISPGHAHQKLKIYRRWLRSLQLDETERLELAMFVASTGPGIESSCPILSEGISEPAAHGHEPICRLSSRPPAPAPRSIEGIPQYLHRCDRSQISARLR
jgi:hypothetical protein